MPPALFVLVLVLSETVLGSFLEFFDTSDHTIDDFVGRPRVKEYGLPSGDIDTIGAVTKTRREP
jgi:hypothetical protein